MRASAARRGVTTLFTGLLSFRVLVALATSASVTGAVAGPMAYQAAKARDEVVVAAPTTVPPATTTTSEAEQVDPPPPTTTTTTSTTTTTTVAGRPAPASTTTTTAPPLSSTGLFMSVYSDHSSPVPLDGGRARFRSWIFVDAPGVTSVRFWVDDPTGAGEPDRVAEVPFDLDPDGIDLRLTYGLGRHTVLAEMTTVDGTFRRLATFDVVG